MKRAFLAALVVLTLSLFAFVPTAQAQCSGYLCSLFNCPWYQHIADETFSNSCTNWGFSGTAGVTTNAMCGWSGNNVGYIGRNQYASGGTIAQTFQTSNSYLDIYDVSYFIETTNMSAGDTVNVYIIDTSTVPSTWNLIDTITSNTSCQKKTYSYTNPGWKNKAIQIRFEGNFASTSTFAYIDYVAFWQKTQ